MPQISSEFRSAILEKMEELVDIAALQMATSLSERDLIDVKFRVVIQKAGNQCQASATIRFNPHADYSNKVEWIMNENQLRLFD